MTPMTNSLPLPAQGAGKIGSEPRGEAVPDEPDQPRGRIEGEDSRAGDFAKFMAQRDKVSSETSSVVAADGDASGLAERGAEGDTASEADDFAQFDAVDPRSSERGPLGRVDAVQGRPTPDKQVQMTNKRSSPRGDNAGGDILPPNGQQRQMENSAMQGRVMNAEVQQMRVSEPVSGGSEKALSIQSKTLWERAPRPLANSRGERLDVPGRVAGAMTQEPPVLPPTGESKVTGVAGQADNKVQTVNAQPRASMLAAQITRDQSGLMPGSVPTISDPAPDRFAALDTAFSPATTDTSLRPSGQAQQVQTALSEPKALAIVRDALVEMNAKAQREIEIQLSPRDLGKLRFVMAPSEGQISVQITADRPEVLDALRRHAESFAQDLGSEGFGHAEFEFIHRDDDRDAPRNDAMQGEAGTDMGEPDRQERRWQIASGRLDVRI